MNRESSDMTGLHVINVRPARPGLRVFPFLLTPPEYPWKGLGWYGLVIDVVS